MARLQGHTMRTRIPALGTAGLLPTPLPLGHVVLMALAGLAGAIHGTAADYPIEPVPAARVHLAPGNFWFPRLETNRTVTVRHNFEQCEKTGRLDNFRKAAGEKEGFYEGLRFNDSDVYKVMQGASYALARHPDPELDAEMDALIATLARAQEPDGYLYTVMQVPHDPAKTVKGVVPGERWMHEQESHETYCMGHLIEAAVAHFEATGKTNFLQVAVRVADLLVNTFGPDKLRLPPGHQQIEIGLVELYRATGNRDHLDLAAFFLDQRGRLSGDRRQTWGSYFQDARPVREET